MCARERKSADFTNIIAGCLTLRINGRHTTPTVINYITTTTVVNNNTTTAITHTNAHLGEIFLCYFLRPFSAQRHWPAWI